MNNQAKKNLVTFLLAVFILACASPAAHALIWANCSEEAFDGSCGNCEPSEPLGDLIVVGAENFLKSYSGYLLFLSKIETSGLIAVDHQDLNGSLSGVILKMEAVQDTYKVITALADGTPYNQDVINRLKAFDYPGSFSAKGLNGDILSEVALFLGSGDVRGAFYKLLSDTDDIVSRLKELQTRLAAGTTPGLSGLWDLNEAYSRALNFGQYMSRVFFAVKDNPVI